MSPAAEAGRHVGRLGTLLVIALTLVIPPAAARAQQWTVKGEGALRAEVGQAQPGGALTLSIRRAGATVLPSSPLGIVTRDADLSIGMRVRDAHIGRVFERYTTVSGKRRLHAFRATQLRLDLANAAGRRLSVEVRVAADGVAYRYVIGGHGPVEVLRETGGFELPAGETPLMAAWTPSYEVRWGGPFERSSTGDRGEFGFPALVRSGNGADWMLLSEAGVDGRYAASHLQQDPLDPRLMRLAMPRPTRTSPFGPIETSSVPSTVSGTLPLKTPWRVAVVGSLGTIVGSDLITDLAPPSRIANPAWIHPGVALWSWLSDHSSPASFERQREYVDFAGAHGFRYVVVDAGPDPSATSGYSPGWRLWPNRIPELVAEGRSRGVGLIFWVHADDLRDEGARRALLGQLAALGVAGVKVDFFDSDTQDTMRLVDEILADAARDHLVVELHGATLPKGLQRTWPNLLSIEAVRGAEYYGLHQQFGDLVPAPDPRHILSLPFTRNVVGSMDFTPVNFSAQAAPGRVTTDGAELAQAVLDESGLQVLGDSIESYAAHPVALHLLERLPAAWDDTRLLAGEPGVEAVIARRAGRTWWVAGMIAGPSRTLTVPLSSLGCRRWRGSLVTDSPSGLRARALASAGRAALRVELPANGGFVARLKPRT